MSNDVLFQFSYNAQKCFAFRIRSCLYNCLTYNVVGMPTFVHNARNMRHSFRVNSQQLSLYCNKRKFGSWIVLRYLEEECIWIIQQPSVFIVAILHDISSVSIKLSLCFTRLPSSCGTICSNNFISVKTEIKLLLHVRINRRSEGR